MKWILAIVLFVLAGCTIAPAAPSPSKPVVFEVYQQQSRPCPPLPALSDNATLAARTAFTRTVVLMYAQCAKGE